MDEGFRRRVGLFPAALFTAGSKIGSGVLLASPAPMRGAAPTHPRRRFAGGRHG
jgi:hypothetical protein